ncbi:response regulator [Colwellia ponticola]|uniref:response regulator n=1 Tax=Colwellia ponticola TaxID=2304625 RepID=UPI001FECF52E|nr:response regulator [Colwellia ponticola]
MDDNKVPIKVVYIDDEELLCQIFKEYLHSTDINITTFTDELSAITYCNETNPDIIFIDYRLTQLNGVDVAKAIVNDAIKVLITGELDVAMDHCFSDKIQKPYRLAAIKSLIIDAASYRKAL